MDHPLARSLIDIQYASLGNGSIVIPENECFCMDWLENKGSDMEKRVANGLQWFAFSLSVVILCYYAYATWKTTCGWEEVYVCCVELTKVIIEFFHEFDEPAMLFLSSGSRVQWLRYGEWLMTCPVILIHLSNLTGLKDDYSKRTMRLLVSDIGTIVWGATSAMSQGYVKIIFFLMGLGYGANTFFHAAKVYIESYHTVPKGVCRTIVRAMAWTFFASWGMFPVLFLLGPEGFGHLTVYGSTIGHTVIDLLSKNVWGLMGNYLRLKIHEHILLHGDIRKLTKIKVAGQELEVETLVAEEDADTVKKPTAAYANRESFLVMRDKLKEKGYEVRASLENSGVEAAAIAASAANAIAGGKAGLELGKLDIGDMQSSQISPGRVILAVPDISMVEFFREQFVQLPVAYEVVPALGADNTVQLVQQAAALGGCDFVLMHPEFLRDKSPNNLPTRLRALGQRTAAFGWAPLGPVRELIESSGLDGYLEGPSFGAGISLSNLTSLISRMQQLRRMSMMAGRGGMMGGGMMGGGGMGGMGMGAMGMGAMGMGAMGMPGMGMGAMGMPGMGMGAMGMPGMGMGAMGTNGMPMNTGSLNNGMSNGLLQQQQQMMLGNGGGMPAQMSNGAVNGMGHMTGMQQMPTIPPGMNSQRVGTNPLFGSAPSPLSSQPGQDGQVAAVAPAAGPAPAMGGGTSEAEMLQQLMAEINRLKNELGDQH